MNNNALMPNWNANGETLQEQTNITDERLKELYDAVSEVWKSSPDGEMQLAEYHNRIVSIAKTHEELFIISYLSGMMMAENELRSQRTKKLRQVLSDVNNIIEQARAKGGS